MASGYPIHGDTQITSVSSRCIIPQTHADPVNESISSVVQISVPSRCVFRKQMLIPSTNLSPNTAVRQLHCPPNLGPHFPTVCGDGLGGDRRCSNLCRERAYMACRIRFEIVWLCQSLLSVRSISRQSTRILPGHLQFPAESPPFQHLQVCLQLANVFRLLLGGYTFGLRGCFSTLSSRTARTAPDVVSQ